MKTLNTEVLVIGSGFGAAAPALRLAQAGARVLIIEKGPDIIPERDFRQTQDPKYLLKYLKGVSCRTAGFTYAEGLGGGSGFYEMVSLRTPTLAFQQVDEHGRRYWPAGLDRKVLDPYYDRAEAMLNVEQIGVDEVPRTGVVFSQLMKNLGYSCDRARYAVKGCLGSGFCVTGCIYGAKQSLHMNYLPQAVQAGARVITDVEARSIHPLVIERSDTDPSRPLSDLPYRYAVSCKDHTNQLMTIEAKVVILGGGTVGTAALLMRSRPSLKLLSAHVGKNIAFNGSIKVVGLLPEGSVEGDMVSGRSHPGMISYQFLDSMGITVAAAKPLPVQMVSAAHFVPEGETREPAWWGDANVELMKHYRRRMIVLYALGLTRPAAELRLRDKSIKPVLNITPDLERYYNDTQKLLHSIFIRNGAKVVHAHKIDREGRESRGVHFDTTHMVGSCRMADHKEHGVVDMNGQVFDYPGLYVSDGAAVPSSLAVNTSLTILANAERVAEHLVSRYARRPSFGSSIGLFPAIPSPIAVK